MKIHYRALVGVLATACLGGVGWALLASQAIPRARLDFIIVQQSRTNGVIQVQVALTNSGNIPLLFFTSPDLISMDYGVGGERREKEFPSWPVGRESPGPVLHQQESRQCEFTIPGNVTRFRLRSDCDVPTFRCRLRLMLVRLTHGDLRILNSATLDRILPVEAFSTNFISPEYPVDVR